MFEKKTNHRNKISHPKREEEKKEWIPSGEFHASPILRSKDGKLKAQLWQWSGTLLIRMDHVSENRPRIIGMELKYEWGETRQVDFTHTTYFTNSDDPLITRVNIHGLKPYAAGKRLSNAPAPATVLGLESITFFLTNQPESRASMEARRAEKDIEERRWMREKKSGELALPVKLLSAGISSGRSTYAMVGKDAAWNSQFVFLD